MQRLVAFLDLLGFKEFMSQDKEGAIRLLWNYEIVLAAIKIEDNIHPPESYDEELRKIAEIRAATSFEYLLPFSDNFIITSRELSADLFLKQLGSFILRVFLFTAREYRGGEETTKVKVTHLIDNGGGNFEKKLIEEEWFPTLFRGGISFGDAEILEMLAVFPKKGGKSYCVAGEAVIEAVELEGKIRCPGVIFSDPVYQKIEDKNLKEFYISKDGEYYRLLWPAFLFIEENDPKNELIKFNEVFIPAANLWKAYSHSNCSDLYFNFLKLIIKSTYSFFQGRIEAEKVTEMIRSAIARVHLEQKTRLLLEL